MKRLALGALLLLVGFAIARAEDVVIRTDGARLKGTVLSETPEEVRIRTAAGVLTVPRSEIQSVLRAGDGARAYAEKQAALEKKPSAKGFYELARWCHEKELWFGELEALKRTIALDPEHEQARTELGYRRLRGAWVTESAYYRDQGYVQHEGRWVTKADKEKLDQGLVKWSDGEWIPAAEAVRRQEALDREAEKERQGVPTHKTDNPSGGEEQPPPSKKKEPAPKNEAPRFFEGKLLYTKSKEQILAQLAAIDAEKIPPLPKNKVEFAPLDDATQAAALRRLKQYRYLCDVPTDIEINFDYAQKCTAAAQLLELVGHLDHTPKKPAGCSDSLYKMGYAGTSNSNLHQGRGAASSVDGFMDDSDPSNVDRVGHRRWCLNVTMKNTAFGSTGNFTAMWSIDHGHPAPPYDAVLYPSRGYFPLTHVREGIAWSCYLAPRFATMKDGDVKVVVTPIDVNMKRGTPVELEYLHVDAQPFGTGSSCIIFRPKVSWQAGARYWVEVRSTKAADPLVEYLVEFF